MRHAALLGYPCQRRQPFLGHDSFYPPGVAREASPPARRLCAGGRVRPRFQRGVLASPMELAPSVIAYLALLLLVAALRIFELRVSRRHQEHMVSRGAKKIVDRKFRWMVLGHTGVLLGSACEVVFFKRPLIPALAAVMVALFLAANAMRWWVIRTMGQHWNVQVVDSTQLGVV